MNPEDTYTWTQEVPPTQRDMDWYVLREFGGKWYFLTVQNEITTALDRETWPHAPYDGDIKLEIP